MALVLDLVLETALGLETTSVKTLELELVVV